MLKRVIRGTALACFAVLAAYAAASAAHPGWLLGRRALTPASATAWTSGPWTADDRPYQAIRAEIDALAAGGRLTGSLIERYHREASANKRDPQALFRFAYACYQAPQAVPPVHLPYSFNEDLFVTAPSPPTYNYARLRFLIGAASSNGPRLVPMGQRLLKYRSNDYDVRYWLVRCYPASQSEAQKHAALVAAEDLLHRYPGRPGAYADLGFVYFSVFMVKPNPADGRQAVAAYRHYLLLGPPDSERRAQAQRIIDYIQKHPNSR